VDKWEGLSGFGRFVEHDEVRVWGNEGKAIQLDLSQNGRRGSSDQGNYGVGNWGGLAEIGAVNWRREKDGTNQADREIVHQKNGKGSFQAYGGN